MKAPQPTLHTRLQARARTAYSTFAAYCRQRSIQLNSTIAIAAYGALLIDRGARPTLTHSGRLLELVAGIVLLAIALAYGIGSFVHWYHHGAPNTADREEQD